MSHHDAENRPRTFVKRGTGGANASQGVLECEALGLRLLDQAAGSSIRVPQPLSCRDGALWLEFIDMQGIGDMAAFGTGMATVHSTLQQDLVEAKEFKGFGFPLDGQCGAVPQLNPATANWIEFWREHRLGFQLKLIKKRYPHLRELIELGERVRGNLNQLFSDIVVEDIKPCLLHGDLWSGNHAFETGTSKPVIFDPAPYFGHAEAEWGIADMFGGLSDAFYVAYHKIIPEKPSKGRRSLYEVHHHMNHLNIFGSAYAAGATKLLKELNGMIK